jgi:hypothetical protein
MLPRRRQCVFIAFDLLYFVPACHGLGNSYVLVRAAASLREPTGVWPS